MAEQTEKKKGVHWGVKAWVYFHLFMITSWTLPNPPDRVILKPRPSSVGEAVREAPNYLLLANKSFKETPLHFYLNSTGFWQYWNMFSPNPANVDVWMDAEVEFDDGRQMIYKYPKMQDLSLFDRYFKERYRKYVENSHMEKYSYKWPAIAQAIAYLSYDGGGHFPVKVTLRRHFKTIVPLKTFSPPDDYVDPGYETYSFFSYMVDVEKLKRQVHG